LLLLWGIAGTHTCSFPLFLLSFFVYLQLFPIFQSKLGIHRPASFILVKNQPNQTIRRLKVECRRRAFCYPVYSSNLSMSDSDAKRSQQSS
jgi:hypothetical protein